MNRRTCLVVGCVGAAILTGCRQAPPSPAVRAFGDNKFWITIEPMEYIIGTTRERIVVPQGFVTDFASIPQSLWSFGLAPQGQYSRAAIVHDYLYWAQSCSREQSDRLLVIAMKESEVGRFDEFAVFQGVRRGGQRAWDSNADERKAGLPRVVPEEYQRPTDPNMRWPAYRTLLVQKGVMDPLFESNPTYCAFGDSTTVP